MAQKRDLSMSRRSAILPRSRALRLALACAVALLVLVLYVATVGFTVDTTQLSDKAAALLTQSLGRPVHVEGAVHIKVSAHPSLAVDGLQVANAPGFAGGDFAHLGKTRLALDLWPLLRAQLRINELFGSDVQIRLQQDKKGNRNWNFGPPAQGPEPAQAPASRPAINEDLAKLLAHLDVERLTLETLNVAFIGTDAKSHFFELTSLVARIPAGQPLTLTVRGTVEKT